MQLNDVAILIKHDEQVEEIKRPRKLYRLKFKSNKLDAIITELESHAESRWFQHDGEEMHLVLQGEMEYIVGDHSYKLSKGDILWHKSSIRHRAKNHSKSKVVYITIGAPPTFVWSTL